MLSSVRWPGRSGHGAPPCTLFAARCDEVLPGSALHAHYQQIFFDCEGTYGLGGRMRKGRGGWGFAEGMGAHSGRVGEATDEVPTFDAPFSRLVLIHDPARRVPKYPGARTLLQC